MLVQINLVRNFGRGNILMCAFSFVIFVIFISPVPHTIIGLFSSVKIIFPLFLFSIFTSGAGVHSLMRKVSPLIMVAAPL